MDKFKELIPSQNIRYLLYGLGALLLVLLIFHAGVVAGSHRRHSERGEWGFRPPFPGFFDVRLPRGFILDGHGTVGVVQSVGSSSIILQTRDDSTKTVFLSSKTIIRAGFGDASSTALSPGLHIVVLGTPNNDGALFADLIRVMSKNTPSR